MGLCVAGNTESSFVHESRRLGELPLVIASSFTVQVTALLSHPLSSPPLLSFDRSSPVSGVVHQRSQSHSAAAQHAGKSGLRISSEHMIPTAPQRSYPLPIPRVVVGW